MKTFSLCSSCDACPVVEIGEDIVRIGEEGNQCTLKKSEWNVLVEKIKTEDLR